MQTHRCRQSKKPRGISMFALWSQRKCRHKCGKKHIGGRACRFKPATRNSVSCVGPGISRHLCRRGCQVFCPRPLKSEANKKDRTAGASPSLRAQVQPPSSGYVPPPSSGYKQPPPIQPPFQPPVPLYSQDTNHGNFAPAPAAFANTTQIPLPDTRTQNK